MDDSGPSCSRKPQIQHNVNKNHVVQAVLCCIINRKRQDRYGLWQTMPFCVLRRKTKKESLSAIDNFLKIVVCWG